MSSSRQGDINVFEGHGILSHVFMIKNVDFIFYCIPVFMFVHVFHSMFFPFYDESTRLQQARPDETYLLGLRASLKRTWRPEQLSKYDSQISILSSLAFIFNLSVKRALSFSKSQVFMEEDQIDVCDASSLHAERFFLEMFFPSA